MKLTAVAAFISIFQVAVAAAPSEPVRAQIPFESSHNIASVVARSWYGPRVIADVEITGYSSTPDQTDDTPFITASGSQTRDGVIAANFLPIGAEVQIPNLFGDKVFTVEDRMHERFSDRVDIWFKDRASAKTFGLKTADIVVLN